MKKKQKYVYIYLKTFKMHTLQMLALTCFEGQKSKIDMKMKILGVANCLGKQDSLCANVAV
jgi:hypothetical protein